MKGGVEGQLLLANDVLLVAASNDAGGWLRDTGGWLQMVDDDGREDAGGWLQATLGRLTAITAAATSKRGATRCR